MARNPSTRAPPRTPHSRRPVPKAAGTAAALGLIAAGRAVGANAASAGSTDGFSAPVVAYVSDARKSELVVMVGTREIIRRDSALVAPLMSIAKQAVDVIASLTPPD